MGALQSHFTVVPYDASGRAMPAISIDYSPTDRSVPLWETVRLALPPGSRSFAVYDHQGSLVRIGVLPAEPLTDDPDVTAMAFDTAGHWVLTGHADGNVRLWDIETGDPIWTRAPADEPITGVAFIETIPAALAWSDDGPLLLFSLDDGTLSLRVERPQEGAFVAVPSPAGDEVAMTGPQVQRFSLPEGELLPPLDADRAMAATAVTEEEGPVDEGVLWLAYLPQEETIVGVRAGEPEDELVFWDRRSGERLTTLGGLIGVAACDLSSDGRIAAIALSGERTTVLLVDTVRREIARTVRTEGQGIYDLRFAPNGGALILHDVSLGIVSMDPQSGEMGAPIPEDGGGEYVIPRDDETIPDERETPPMMVTHDRQGMLELTPLEARGPFGPSGRAISADGARYASVPFSTDNNYVTVYDLVLGMAIATLPHQGNVQEIWLSADGQRVAVRAAGHVTVWNIPDAPASIEPR